MSAKAGRRQFAGLLLVAALIHGSTVLVEPAVALVEPAAGQADTPTDDSLLFATPTTKDHIGRIVAPVTIDGHLFRFVVDTGASHSTVSPSLVQALGLVTDNETQIIVNGVTGTANAPSVVIGSLRVGDLKIGPLRLPVVWAPLMAGQDGILGVAGLNIACLSVDFEQNRVAIFGSATRPTRDYVRVPAKKLKSGLITVNASVGGVRAVAVIDTGAQRSLGNLALRDALSRRRGREEPASEPTDVYGSTSEVVRGEMRGSPMISLGDVRIADVSLVYGEFHIFDVWKMNDKPALIVGMDVLGSVNAFRIDFRTQDLYVLGRYLGM
jgi:predicted aspartyl protease